MKIPSKNKIVALIISSILVLLVVSVLAPSFSADDADGQKLGVGYGYGYGYGACTRTQGYWKTHKNAWPIDEITIGGVTYTKTEAINWLKTPVKDDMTIAMFYQLVAAKLNVANGCTSSCIGETITAADNWMSTYGPVGSGISASSLAWGIGEPLKDSLDDYNNGLLCAPHCD